MKSQIAHQIFLINLIKSDRLKKLKVGNLHGDLRLYNLPMGRTRLIEEIKELIDKYYLPIEALEKAVMANHEGRTFEELSIHELEIFYGFLTEEIEYMDRGKRLK